MCVQILLGAIEIYILFYAFKYLHSNIRLILEYRFVSLCLICTHLIYPLFYASKCFNKPIRVFKVLLIKKWIVICFLFYLLFCCSVFSAHSECICCPAPAKEETLCGSIAPEERWSFSWEQGKCVCGGTDLFMWIIMCLYLLVC